MVSYELRLFSSLGKGMPLCTYARLHATIVPSYPMKTNIEANKSGQYQSLMYSNVIFFSTGQECSDSVTLNESRISEK